MKDESRNDSCSSFILSSAIRSLRREEGTSAGPREIHHGPHSDAERAGPMGEASAALQSNRAETPSEEFVRVFRELWPELVSKLTALLGNHADAQDAGQHAFLKCWRARVWRPEVRNLRAWPLQRQRIPGIGRR